MIDQTSASEHITIVNVAVRAGRRGVIFCDLDMEFSAQTVQV